MGRSAEANTNPHSVLYYEYFQSYNGPKKEPS
jgi:hypothetical protein